MAARDDKYRKFVVGQACLCQPCATPPEFHHMTRAPTYAPGEQKPKEVRGARGKGQTAADYYGLPLCPRHHGQRHRLTGYFDGWTRHELRYWEEAEHARLRTKYEGRTPDAAPAAQRTLDRFLGKTALDLDADARRFIADHSLGEQAALDLRRLIERAKKQGRAEAHAAGRRPR
jgi:hypothetical protein